MGCRKKFLQPFFIACLKFTLLVALCCLLILSFLIWILISIKYILSRIIEVLLNHYT